TTATLPTGIAAVSGAGTYTNGQSGQFTAPASITNPPSLYTFRRFTLNGVQVSTSPAYNKTFFTADPTNVALVAEYDVRNIQPVIAEVSGVVTNPAVGAFAVVTNPVPAMTNYQLSIRFDRIMRSVPEPLVVLTNPGAAAQPIVRTGGVWFTTTLSNDT